MRQALTDEVLPSEKGTINLNYAINPSVLFLLDPLASDFNRLQL